MVGSTSQINLEEKLVKSPQPVALPEEVYISIGVDTERVFSYVPAKTDHTALCEAASTSPHVFKIPLEK